MISSTVQRNKQMKTIWKSLRFSWLFVWKANNLFAILYLAIELFCATLPLLQVYFLNLIIDAVLLGQINKTLDSALFWGISILLGLVLGTIKIIIKGRIDACSSKSFNSMIAQKMVKLPMAVLDTSEGRDLCEYARDCGTIVYDEIPFALFSVAKELYTFLVSIVVLLNFNVLLVVLYLLFTIPGIIIDYIFYIKIDEFRRTHAADGRKMFYYRWMLVDSWPAKDVRMYNLTDSIKGRYKQERKKYYDQNKKLDKKQMYAMFLTEIVRRVGEFGLFAYIVYCAFNGSITIGNIELYTGYALIAADAFSSGLSKLLGYVKFDCDTVMPRFFEFLNLKCLDDQTGIYSLNHFESLQFEDVYFKYPNTERYVLSGVSFTLRCGERLSIVGINGAGKSTIVKLILGLYEIDSGRILINGYPMSDYDISDVRKLFSVLFQSFAQYPLTLRENVAFSAPERLGADTELEEALQKAGVLDELKTKLKNGLDSFLTRQFDDEGKELSKGQWQKVALSRAYFKNSPIIIFDEPSSALDAEAEDRIFKNFEELSEGKTAILISHRISSARLASQIIVLDCGKVVESGTHEALIASNGLYAKLYCLQREKYTILEEKR